jgi:hypothetical protein
MEFYSLFQMRQIPQAETFCTLESRARLRDQAGPFLSFRIVSIDMKEDEKNAGVVVELTQIVPAVAMPFPVQRDTKWLIEEGEWRLYVPEPAADLVEAMTAAGRQEPPKPEELVFKGHSFGLGVMKPGDRKEARFPFTNTTDHPVTMVQVQTGCKCLTVKTQKMEYQPGESGELVIEYDSAGYEYEFRQSVVVKTNPGSVTSYLHIHGNVVPKAIAEEAGRKPNRVQQPAPQ